MNLAHYYIIIQGQGLAMSTKGKSPYTATVKAACQSAGPPILRLLRNNGSKFHYGVASVPKEEVDSNALYSILTNYFITKLLKFHQIRRRERGSTCTSPEKEPGAQRKC